MATPYDIEYPKNDESNKQYCVRQNVVLELRMLLAGVVREKLSFCFLMQKKNLIPSLYVLPRNSGRATTRTLSATRKKAFGRRDCLLEVFFVCLKMYSFYTGRYIDFDI